MRIALALSLLAAAAHAQVVEPGLGERIHDWMSRMETFGMHGALYVEHDGRVILEHGYGVADHDADRPITQDTVFHLGSLGKQFTASAIMLLQSQGALSVHDPISAHLADVPDDKQSITIHHLLTHTSGLPYQPTPGDVLDTPLQFTPGERWSYSNPGYRILHDVIEAAAGVDYCTFLRRSFFTPLEMTNTDCAGEPFADHADLARAYTNDTDQGTVVDLGRPAPYRGAGDIASTVGDLALWEHALRGAAVLPQDAVDDLFTEHARNGAMAYGYGWMIFQTPRDTRVILHSGNLGGFNADYRRYVDEDLTVVFLSNHFVNGRSMRDAVMNNISYIVHGDEPLDAPTVIEAPLDHLAGDYVLPSGAAITLSTRDDVVLARAADAEGLRLLYAGDLDDAGIRSFGDRTRDVMHALARGDAEPLRQAISPSLPFEGARDGLLAAMRSLKEAHGDYRHCTLRGVAPIAAAARVYVDLQFERAACLYEVTWSGGILHMTQVDAPPARVFAPVADDQLVAFDIFTGERILIEVEQGAIRFPDADVRAPRA